MPHVAWVILAMVAAVIAAVVTGLSYAIATVLFGVIGLVGAPIVIHKLEKPAAAGIGLIILAGFSSFPAKKLLTASGSIEDLAITVGYAALFWVAGLGWTRDWKN